ncbi:hypothetical protein XFF6994_840003 [Xanthomonas citri pv. fuscans]|nr:hypothetical protein XFF6994_840003 [Xanthomonas citri pv. fuscans]
MVDDGVHGGLALGWLVDGRAGNGCPDDDQTGQCTSGVRGCRAPGHGVRWGLGDGTGRDG